LPDRDREQHRKLRDRVCVRRSLGTHLDQEPFQKLDPLVLEVAERHEAVIFDTLQRS
jgi:hypothetical protein